MTTPQILFYAFGALAIISALGMLLNLRNTVAAALSLVVTMIALAGIFVLLEAHLVAAIHHYKRLQRPLSGQSIDPSPVIFKIFGQVPVNKLGYMRKGQASQRRVAGDNQSHAILAEPIEDLLLAISLAGIA